LWLRLRSLFRSAALDRELDDEMRFHLEHQIAMEIAAGKSAEEARTAALAGFGGVTRIKEECRETRGFGWFERVRQDARYAWRAARREPGFAAVAILTLAMGVGLNAAMFTIVRSVLLRPLPYDDPDRLMMIYSTGHMGPMKWTDGTFSDADVYGLRTSAAFTTIAAYHSMVSTLTGAGDAADIRRVAITPNLLPLLGRTAALGRGFVEDDAAARVVLISDALWTTRFGRETSIVGRALTLDGVAYTVVGVMPPSFVFPPAASAVHAPAVWTPLPLDPAYRRNAMQRVIGRLAPGVSREAAEGSLKGLAHDRARDATSRRAGVRVEDVMVVGFKEAIVGSVRQLLVVFTGAIGLVLLVACANLANLLLARGAARAKEMAVRASLGAGRGRLTQQLLTESALLAAAGGLAGLFVAHGGVAWVTAHMPADTLPRGAEVALDGAVLAFTAVLCAVTVVLFGVLPAVGAANADLAVPLQTGQGRSTTAGGVRFRSAILTIEVALVVVLLAGAGLLFRSIRLLESVDPGFRPEGVMTLQITLPDLRYHDTARRRAFVDAALARLAAIPGAGDPSAVTLLPFGEMSWGGDFNVEGSDTPPNLLVAKPAVTPNYFRAVGIPLLKGRVFDEHDRDGAARVAIVSDSVARVCWPGTDPIGKRIAMDREGPDRWQTVVGVVGDIRQGSLAKRPTAAIYVPFAQEWRGFFMSNVSLLVRATDRPGTAAASLRDVVRALDADLPTDRVATLDQLLARSTAEPRFRTELLVLFAALALALASVGVYGLAAYDVARRRREIGIRVALGAQRNDVLRQVVGGCLAFVSAGMVVGLGASFAVTRALEAFLFGVRAHDPATFAVACAVLLLAALAAALGPAVRATRIAPVEALRLE